MAVAYARAHHRAYSAILWLNGESRFTLLQSLVAFSKRADIDQSTNSTVTDSTDPQDIENSAQAVMKWLTLEDNDKWLIIFDNVDQAYGEHTSILQDYDISSFLPPADQGYVLIITRSSSLCDLGTSTRLGNMAPDQALELLCGRSGISRSTEGTYICQQFALREQNQRLDTMNINRLAERLDYLLLALVQAAMFIRMTSTTCHGYLNIYDRLWSTLAAEVAGMPDDRAGSIEATWMISYNHVKETNPTSAQLLELWAYLDHYDIFYELFLLGSENTLGSPLLKQIVESKANFESILKPLLAYSLAESFEDSQSYSLRHGIHDWFSKTCRHGDIGMNILAIFIIGTAGLDADEKSMQRRLLPHANRCIHRLFNSKIIAQDHSFDLYSKFTGIATLYQNLGIRDEAEKILQRVLDTEEDIWGLDHIHTRQAKFYLGNLYEQQGRLKEAEKMYQGALNAPDVQPVSHGSVEEWVPHPALTLAILRSLSHLYIGKGWLGKAEEINQQAIDHNTKFLGFDHPWTLEAAKKVGELRMRQGKFAEALDIYESAFDGYERWVGKGLVTDEIWTIRHNQGVCLLNQGKWAEAEEMCGKALDAALVLYGADDEQTRMTVSNIDFVRKMRGGTAGA
ncbi:MAG: hypothetical protein Q9217_004106 [Psora testacea]